MDRRFYCPEIPGVGETISLSTEESHHFTTVLRGRAGESALLMDGCGVIAEADVVDVAGRRQPVRCIITTRTVHPQPPTRVHLYVAPARGKGMVSIIRSAAEMGAQQITPIICARSTSKPDSSALDAWTAAAITGIKQSINPYCPKIHAPALLETVLDGDVPPGYVGWVPDEQPAGTPERIDTPVAALFIGPEGGFTEEEIGRLIENDVRPASFSPYVLRVETAVVAGLSWLNQLYERF